MNSGGAFDRFARGAIAQWGAFAWGVAEATAFFIVPDVWLSSIGCRSIRKGLRATTWAILGALVGGLIMYGIARHTPDSARQFLTHIPAIHPPLLERVQSQISDRGCIAVLLGPTEGIPYKIYAVEWGARRNDAVTFALITIPARGIRFALSVLLSGGIGRLLAPWTKRRANVELTILILFWVTFYTFYFIHFGW